MANELSDWPPKDYKPKPRAKLKPLLTFGMAATVLLTFAAGFTAARIVFPPTPQPPDKPLGDILKKLEQPLPLPPGAKRINRDLGGSSIDGHPLEKMRSVHFTKELYLVYPPDQMPKTPRDMETKLREVRDFYEGYLRSQGLRFEGRDSNWLGVNALGAQGIVNVTANYHPADADHLENITVDIIVFDSGYDWSGK